MNNKNLKEKFKKVTNIIPMSGFTKGYKKLAKQHRKDILDKIKDIIDKLETFDIDTQFKNHVLSDKITNELHVTSDILLTYKYIGGKLYINLILINLSNHKELKRKL